MAKLLVIPGTENIQSSYRQPVSWSVQLAGDWSASTHTATLSTPSPITLATSVGYELASNTSTITVNLSTVQAATVALGTYSWTLTQTTSGSTRTLCSGNWSVVSGNVMVNPPPFPYPFGSDLDLSTDLVQATGSTTKRTLGDRFADVVNVKDFGAVGDGVTEDASSINAAIAYAGTGKGIVYFPAGTYRVTATIFIPNNTTLYGAGPQITIIKLANGANTNVVSTTGASALFGTNSSSGIFDFNIWHLTIDGNRSNNSSGSGLLMYGCRFTVYDVMVTSCAEYGIRSEWSSNAAAPAQDYPFLESSLTDVWTGNNLKDGILYNGPHDGRLTNVVAALNNYGRTGAYSGITVGAKAGGAQLLNCHSWGDDHDYAYDISAGVATAVGCESDGCYYGYVRIAASGVSFHGECISGYSPSSTAVSATTSTIRLGSSAGATYNDFQSISGCYVSIVSGTGSGQSRLISSYDSGTTIANISPNWGVTPDATSVWNLIPPYMITRKGVVLGKSGTLAYNVKIDVVSPDCQSALDMTYWGGYGSVNMVGAASYGLQLAMTQAAVTQTRYTGSFPSSFSFANITLSPLAPIKVIAGEITRVSQDNDPAYHNVAGSNWRADGRLSSAFQTYEAATLGRTGSTTGPVMVATYNGSNVGTIDVDSNSMQLYKVKFTSHTFMDVTAMPTATTGRRGMVSNSSQAYTSANLGVILSTVAGANTIPVYSDGTNWRIG